MRRSHIVIASLATLFLVGCSGVKTYRSASAKNLRVETQIDSGAVLKSTDVKFDIYRVDAGCNTHYLGRVYLDNTSTTVGVPPNETLYLDFIFTSSGFLSNSSAATRYTTLLTTRPGFEYDARAKYLKGIYGVTMHERRRGSAAGRLVERRSLDACSGQRTAQ